MALIIEKATDADCAEVAQLYDALHAYLSSHTNYPGWKAGVYPALEDAEAGIRENALFTARLQGKIAGTFILSHRPEPGYAQADWRCVLEDSRVFVLYTLAVHPDYLRRGVGKQMLEFVSGYAKAQDMRAVRLDVYERNLPAIRLYEACGFDYIATMDLGYAAYGLDRFRLYQKLL